jgi:recombination protein RecR
LGHGGVIEDSPPPKSCRFQGEECALALADNDRTLGTLEENHVASSAGPEIERLIALLAKLPGLGPRSARRAALALLKKRDQLLVPLAETMAEAATKVRACSVCGAPDTRDPCSICSDQGRDPALLCVVEEAGALWAMERMGAYRGRYHVLGGLLSALDGIGPEALHLSALADRARDSAVREVILALPATVEGQTTAHYIAERLQPAGVTVTSLARGVPVGGELDWLDDGTIAQALRARRPA